MVSGLLVRCSVTFLAVLRSGLNLKEQIFVSLAWIPKATVQVKYQVEWYLRDMYIIIVNEYNIRFNVYLCFCYHRPL